MQDGGSSVLFESSGCVALITQALGHREARSGPEEEGQTVRSTRGTTGAEPSQAPPQTQCPELGLCPQLWVKAGSYVEEGKG